VVLSVLVASSFSKNSGPFPCWWRATKASRQRAAGQKAQDARSTCLRQLLLRCCSAGSGTAVRVGLATATTHSAEKKKKKKKKGKKKNEKKT